MLSVNLLLNPRQLPVFRLALFGKGNVNAAIMIQLSRPDPGSLPAAGASRSRESLSGILSGIWQSLSGVWQPPHALVVPLIAVINSHPGGVEAQGLLALCSSTPKST